MVDNNESVRVTAAICTALDGPAVAAGFAAGQPWAGEGAASVIFCSDPATLAGSLRVLVDDETHGPGGPQCIDLTVAAALAPVGWTVTRADLEGHEVALAGRDLEGALVELAAWLERQSAVSE